MQQLAHCYRNCSDCFYHSTKGLLTLGTSPVEFLIQINKRVGDGASIRRGVQLASEPLQSAELSPPRGVRPPVRHPLGPRPLSLRRVVQKKGLCNLLPLIRTLKEAVIGCLTPSLSNGWGRPAVGGGFKVEAVDTARNDLCFHFLRNLLF